MLGKVFLAVTLVFHACWASPIEPLITDGEDAGVGEFPYQVSIQWALLPISKFQHVCGGSIINEKFVLTAGHCILKRGTLRVAAGKHFINKVEETEQVVDVEKAIVHKDYNGGVAQHDIAILKLATPLVFNEFVAPVGLPQQDEQQVGEANLSGWGSISKKIRPVLPTVLQKARVPILDNKDCLDQLNSKSVIGQEPEIFDTQVCTGAAGGQVSACSGDSGGPLAQVVDGVPVQVGIVSWGMYPCGAAGTPSVYTRVASYVDWIKEIQSY